MQEAAKYPSRNTQRPLIGLALGGGVARGWAHIGVIQRLQEAGIRPDIVCGTSVGALVGGFWLAGELDNLEDWARALTKRRMLAYFDLMLNGSGLMGGKRLHQAMQEFIGEKRIEELPSKFVAVTAELATGHETWIDEGSLSDAIEAAYALPGVFPPRAINGRWLIDGALVNPLPVSVCRAMGARLVIAVGLHADAFGRASVQRREKYENPELSDGRDLAATARGGVAERLMLKKLFNASGPTPGLGSVMLASFNIIMDRMTRSRLAGDPPDVLLTPRVGHIALLDFDRADELIALGREAADEALGAIDDALKVIT
ncbi:MAG TPA: patatin-like phospholipase family protein [Parvularculaceae bacterium]|nr:patatin-like phospholipase family protein [Parvularculaceae bacterium]